MLSWLFKKAVPRGRAEADSPTRDALPAAAPASQPAPPTPGADADWTARLALAEGDDPVLLDLVASTAPIEVRQAAIQAVASVEALRSVELRYRDSDRRIARAAKRRSQALTARAEARAKAASLTARAAALAEQDVIPLNQLADLDRAWKALDPDLLEQVHRDGFAGAMERLSSLVRQRGDATLRADRWNVEAREARARLEALTNQVAAATAERPALAEACRAARVLLASPAAAPMESDLPRGLVRALHLAEVVDGRVAWIQALPDPSGPQSRDLPVAALPADGTRQGEEAPQVSPPAVAEDGGSSRVGDDDALAPERRWRTLPALEDGDLRALLDARFQAWCRARSDGERAARAAIEEQAGRARRTVQLEETAALDAALADVERTLGEGRLEGVAERLHEMASSASGRSIDAARRTRLDVAQAEHARLRGWQQWGGQVALDQLVEQAEALAVRAQAARDAPSPLSVAELRESVASLRARWKEIDRLGAGTSPASRRRLEESLATAYAPVAEHAAAQRARREENLAQRQRLLDDLDRVALPSADDDLPTTAAGDTPPSSAAPVRPDWRTVIQSLDRFRGSWRQLGPVEHTVPHAQREPLLGRMATALARLDGPLADARAAAQEARDRLIADARQLAKEVDSGAPARDLTGRVRELQSLWQRDAKALPLSRADEEAAWRTFREAVDAVFSARRVVADRRSAETEANTVARVALIDRLASLAEDLTPAVLRREIGAVTAAWQQLGQVAHAAAELETRFAVAREAAARRLANAEQARRRVQVDALHEKLAICEALEGDPSSDAATAATRWQALPLLPSDWERALALRAGQASGKPTVASTQPTDELLLQAEESLALPCPPELQDARRSLRLKAMKAALEGRRGLGEAPLSTTDTVTVLLGRGGLDAGQRARLDRVLASVPPPAT